MSSTVVLAYSGGLDTTVAIPWLKEHGHEVVAVTVDVGQPGDLDTIRARALAAGAKSAYLVDAKAEFADQFIARALKANALYEGIYPLATALARPLIGRHLVDVARRVGAQKIAHGCTGKGNDQVRFDVCAASLAPDLEVIAPARVWKMTRDEEVAYAAAHRLPISVGVRSPFSFDENLWGRSAECGVLEDPWVEPPEEAFGWTRPPEAAPDRAQTVTVGFEEGRPVSLDGADDSLEAIVRTVNRIAGMHGVGRIDHLESRVVGIKSREVYESPAAVTLIGAHRALEAMVLPRDLLATKQQLEHRYAELIYDGLWYTPLREAIDAFVESTQARVSGEVVVKFFKGSARVIGRRSPNSLYRHDLATYSHGDRFRAEMAEGFIYVWGLPARTWAGIDATASSPAVPAAPKSSGARPRATPETP